MGNKKIVFLGLFTIIVFPVIAFGVNYFFFTESFWDIFKTKKNLLLEILIGLSFGTFSGFAAWKIIELRILLPIRKKYQGVIGSLQMNLPTIIFVSICAGVGEEILFRGVLQSFLGIWITAVVFVAIHGYLNPLDWRLSIYGTFMTLSIAVIGYLHESFGLTTAILAHTMIDIVLFIKLTESQLKVDDE